MRLRSTAPIPHVYYAGWSVDEIIFSRSARISTLDFLSVSLGFSFRKSRERSRHFTTMTFPAAPAASIGEGNNKTLHIISNPDDGTIATFASRFDSCAFDVGQAGTTDLSNRSHASGGLVGLRGDGAANRGAIAHRRQATAMAWRAFKNDGMQVLTGAFDALCIAAIALVGFGQVGLPALLKRRSVRSICSASRRGGSTPMGERLRYGVELRRLSLLYSGAHRITIGE
jgi:hypothetical protein